MIHSCKEVIRSAVQYCDDQSDCVGFVFGGNANIDLASWVQALREGTRWQLCFEHPQFLHGIGSRPDDLTVAAARWGYDLAIFDNKCSVAGREK